MPSAPAATRRDFLMGLAAVIPAAGVLRPSPARAQIDADPFLAVSRVIAGTDALSDGVAARIRGLLAARMDGFDAKLADLDAAMRAAGGDRAAMLGGLDDAQVEVALALAKPWYLGHVGTPSAFVLDDDAAFATFLEAQCWEKIVAEVPRITYPGHGAGWWGAPPPHVTAPAMPAEIADWTFSPDGPPEILPPDPSWKAYATAKYDDIDAARRAKPGADR